jgi:hypothetical protein
VASQHTFTKLEIIISLWYYRVSGLHSSLWETMSRNPVILGIICHHQNPFKSTNNSILIQWQVIPERFRQFHFNHLSFLESLQKSVQLIVKNHFFHK